MSRNSNKNWSFLICLALILTTLAVFYQVHSFEFVNYDDPTYVYENPNIQGGITPTSIKWAFTADYAANWHPLTWLSHMLDWQLFGDNAGGHHLTNLAFHIANTLLLFIVLKRMTQAIWPSAFVAALFALHPLHVESVAWVAERKDVLSTFFWMLTMWSYVRFVSRRNISSYLLVVLFLALGLMSKPMLVTLPFVLLLLDYWPLDRLSSKHEKSDEKYSLSHLVIEKVPLFAIALTSSVVTFIVQRKGETTQMIGNCGLLIRIANASISYLQYINKMIWPGGLAVFYPHPGRDVSILYAVVSAVFLLVVTILILRFATGRRYLFTGWFWYLGTLVPVIGLVQVGNQAMADRYSYITLTGLFIIIAWWLPELLAKWPYRKLVIALLSMMILSALAVRAHLQLRHWRDGIMLCQHSLKVTANNYIMHFCMADMFCKQGSFEQAIQHYTEAIRLEPYCFEAINDLAFTLFKAGRMDEAIYYFKKALEINPQNARIHLNLATALVTKGEFAEAVLHYRNSLAITDTISARTSLGDTLVRLGRFQEAVTEYEKVLRVQPQNAVVHNHIGIILTQLGKFDEAIAHFSQAVQINPNDTNIRDNLNLALTEKQQLQSLENMKK